MNVGGLLREHTAICTICGSKIAHLSGDLRAAQKELRQQGWRISSEQMWSDYWQQNVRGLFWYCPTHEHLRPALKRNRK